MVSAKLFPSRADLTPNMYRIVRKCILCSDGSGALVHRGCTLENSCNHVGYMSLLFGHPGTLLTAVVRFGPNYYQHNVTRGVHNQHHHEKRQTLW
jgi:hypothetical protein